jgi:hypothetical protein
MKKFKVEGWYRHNDDKDFCAITTTQYEAKDAIVCFNLCFGELDFYKITVEEIE